LPVGPLFFEVFRFPPNHTSYYTIPEAPLFPHVKFRSEIPPPPFKFALSLPGSCPTVRSMRRRLSFLIFRVGLSRLYPPPLIGLDLPPRGEKGQSLPSFPFQGILPIVGTPRISHMTSPIPSGALLTSGNHFRRFPGPLFCVLARFSPFQPEMTPE